MCKTVTSLKLYLKNGGEKHGLASSEVRIAVLEAFNMAIAMIKEIDDNMDNSEQKQQSQATMLVRLALDQDNEFFHFDDEAYVTAPVDRHYET